MNHLMARLHTDFLPSVGFSLRSMLSGVWPRPLFARACTVLSDNLGLLCLFCYFYLCSYFILRCFLLCLSWKASSVYHRSQCYSRPCPFACCVCAHMCARERVHAHACREERERYCHLPPPPSHPSAQWIFKHLSKDRLSNNIMKYYNAVL